MMLEMLHDVMYWYAITVAGCFCPLPTTLLNISTRQEQQRYVLNEATKSIVFCHITLQCFKLL